MTTTTTTIMMMMMLLLRKLFSTIFLRVSSMFFSSKLHRAHNRDSAITHICIASNFRNVPPYVLFQVINYVCVMIFVFGRDMMCVWVCDMVWVHRTDNAMPYANKYITFMLCCVFGSVWDCSDKAKMLSCRQCLCKSTSLCQTLLKFHVPFHIIQFIVVVGVVAVSITSSSPSLTIVISPVCTIRFMCAQYTSAKSAA